jgi:hypothetical protein
MILASSCVQRIRKGHRGDTGLQDKAAQRTKVIFELGMLLAPVYDLAKKVPPPVSAAYRIAAATLSRDKNAFINNEIARFSRFNTIVFSRERQNISNKLSDLVNLLNNLANNTTDDDRTKQLRLREPLEEYKRQILELIDQIPIDWTSVVFKEATPFSTHLKIYDAIRTAKRQLHYFDRYLDAGFYPLYLRDVDRSLEIRLVTTKGNQNYGIANMEPISRCAQQEFTNYQLIQCTYSDLHDRNLRIDDRIFNLGPSIKDAGKYATNFAIADRTAQAHQILDDLIRKGTVIS